ncbi:tetratricopeptide (TPR) repeat protein [Cellvibrio fibrivorans]|uniref:Tetratricopeptide (TPR) repeat protein n=2 Tax=Cellvibrio fibrivorans TaxID=126350 RepID=A0ABU1UZK7_9GAMM|nr:tetratricopeptide (TPR) repeat protein [Cellvibrio fibrivorans]
MFTDIVGYSRLMGRNEAMAIEMLGDYRKILLSHIEQQNGQLVEFIGDAIFARFDSAASATAAAIAIQQHLQAFNEVRDKKLPPLQTRIGLHKGEVMLRDGAVFGDSVNIAARLEPLAVADGICISQTVYDEIRFTLSSPAKRLGVQALKNIEQKIRVYLIKPSGIGWRDHLFYFLRGLNKKIVAYRYPLTVCLLAFIVAGFYFIPRWLVPGYAANYVEIADFQNLMNEKGDADYFSAGITEAVRSQLADMRDVYIVDAKEGIHAPIRLEGSVQRLGDNLRIAYRLFRRKDNVQIAGGKLDGTYQDIFILQDRLVGEIARYLADEFELQNFRPAPLRLTGDVTAYDYYLRGLDFLGKPLSNENVDAAIQNFNQSLIYDDTFSSANFGLCEAYRLKNEIVKYTGFSQDAEKFCLKALEQGGDFSAIYASLGALYRDSGRYDKAIEYLQGALQKEPDNLAAIIALAGTYALIQDNSTAESLYVSAKKNAPKNWIVYQEYGYFLIRNGRYEDALENYNKVIKLTSDNVRTLNNIGAAYLYMGNFDKSAAAFERALELEPSDVAYSNLGVMYYYLGDFERAVNLYKNALRLSPDNIEYLSNIADGYFFMEGGSGLSDEYFIKTRVAAEKNIIANSADILPYLYIALSYIHFEDFEKAKEMLNRAEKISPDYVFLSYVWLRLSVLERNDENIIFFYKKAVESGYSNKTILSDPYFSILKSDKFLAFSKK